MESFGIVPLNEENGEWLVFLILHRNGRHWGFPKGKSHANESPKEAAQRELKEETGLEIVRFLSEEPISESYHFRYKGRMVRKTVHYFAAIVQGDVKLQVEEIQEGKWVPLKEAANFLTFAEAKDICARVMRENDFQ